jgi:hypothetical protein
MWLATARAILHERVEPYNPSLEISEFLRQHKRLGHAVANWGKPVKVKGEEPAFRGLPFLAFSFAVAVHGEEALS